MGWLERSERTLESPSVYHYTFTPQAPKLKPPPIARTTVAATLEYFRERPCPNLQSTQTTPTSA